MHNKKITKEHLIQRRSEILAQLGRLDDDIHNELDRHPDEQSIQLEQQEVTLSMVEGLNKELKEIEIMLLDEDVEQETA
ncbi:MAG: hypothetical protein KIT61_11495 [Pyrinomonadaceae bacterium]|nr:hypothetical protein [Blastocatellia bacterium]MCW5957202.1 hypothetical protein [Pyrinomonadaceae bacterium]